MWFQSGWRFALLLVICCLLCLSACADDSTAAQDTTQPTTPATVQATPRSTPTRMPSPTPTPAPKIPLYGGPASLFLSHFGQPISSSTLGNLTVDAFILPDQTQLQITVYHGFVDLLQMAPPAGNTWTEDEGLQACKPFIPPDGVFLHFSTQQNPLLLVWEYQSVSVKQNLASYPLGAHDGTFYEELTTSDKLITGCSFNVTA